MSLFKLEKNRVVVDIDIIMNTPPYAALWESDKTEGKEEATAKMRLLFHMYDLRSQYTTSSTSTRMERIVNDLFPMLLTWFPKAEKDKAYQAAAKMYLASQELIPEHALLDAAQDAVHELATEIKDPKTKDRLDKMGKMRKAMEDLQAVRKMVTEAIEAARTTKGERVVRRREDPSYLHDKQNA